MPDCRKDPLDPITTKKAVDTLGALMSWNAFCVPKPNPKTGGLAVKVTLGRKSAWLSCERGLGELRYQAYDDAGRQLSGPTDLPFYLSHRLTTQAQVVACHLRGQAWSAPG